MDASRKQIIRRSLESAVIWSVIAALAVTLIRLLG